MPARPTRLDIDELTQPTHGVAMEVLQALLDAGYPEEDAFEIAFREAEEWESSRIPEAQPPVESARMAEVRLCGGCSSVSEARTAPGRH